MPRVYVALGSNLGDREQTLLEAVEVLGAEPGVEVVAVSRLIETEPVGVLDQPRFVNGVVALDTTLSARALLDLLLDVERRFGRSREGVPPRARGRSTSTCCSTATSRSTSPGSRSRTRACTSALSSSSPSRKSRLWPPGYTEPQDVAPRRSRRVRGGVELRLKKEYQAVFGLFRYCVLTPDATYLCNKLERTVAPQAAYPYFNLRLEDVWVWDKNRPTRMIPGSVCPRKGIASDIKKPGVSRAGLRPHPDEGGLQLSQLWVTTRADLGKVTQPMLVFRSTEDHVVEPDSARLLLEKVVLERRARGACSRTATTWRPSTTTRRSSSRAAWSSSAGSRARLRSVAGRGDLR